MSFPSQVKALPAHYEDCHGDDWEFRYSWSPNRVELLGTDGEVVKTWSSGESGDVIQLFASALYGSDGLEFAALLGKKPQVKKGKVSKSRHQQRVEFVVHKLQGTMGLQFTSFDFQSIVGKKARKIKSHCDFTGEVLFEDERLPQVKSEAVELIARSCDLAKVEKDDKHNAIILTFNDFLCNSAANLDMQCFVWQCASDFEIILECSWSAEAPSSQVLHICALDFCNLCIGCRRFGSWNSGYDKDGKGILKGEVSQVFAGGYSNQGEKRGAEGVRIFKKVADAVEGVPAGSVQKLRLIFAGDWHDPMPLDDESVGENCYSELTEYMAGVKKEMDKEMTLKAKDLQAEAERQQRRASLIQQGGFNALPANSFAKKAVKEFALRTSTFDAGTSEEEWERYLKVRNEFQVTFQDLAEGEEGEEEEEEMDPYADEYEYDTGAGEVESSRKRKDLLLRIRQDMIQALRSGEPWTHGQITERWKDFFASICSANSQQCKKLGEELTSCQLIAALRLCKASFLKGVSLAESRGKI